MVYEMILHVSIYLFLFQELEQYKREASKTWKEMDFDSWLEKYPAHCHDMHDKYMKNWPVKNKNLSLQNSAWGKNWENTYLYFSIQVYGLNI